MSFGRIPLIAGQTGCSSSSLVPFCFPANKAALGFIRSFFFFSVCNFADKFTLSSLVAAAPRPQAIVLLQDCPTVGAGSPLSFSIEIFPAVAQLRHSSFHIQYG